MSFVCEVCGQEHEGIPMDIEAIYPAEYLAVPPEERDKRLLFSPDFCVIDNEQFIIRGVLPVPVKENDQEFRWGVWAIVDESDFKRYLELWDAPDQDQEPPFSGKLSGGVPRHPETDLLPVSVHLISPDQRPTFKVTVEDHPFWVMQQDGVTLQYVHDEVFGLMKEKQDREKQDKWDKRIDKS